MTEKYQLRGSDMSKLNVKDKVMIPKDPPQMILVVGPCRTGTTALSNVFARLGMPAYMQPIKSMRRAVEEGGDWVDWDIDSELSRVLSKETIGPKTEAEFFDPAEILLELGYPADRLILIPVLREPLATLTSWNRMWEGGTMIDGFIKSYKVVIDMINKAEKNGVKVIPYVHELIRGRDSAGVVEKLLDLVDQSNGLDYDDQLTNWEQGPVFAADQSNIVLFDSPPERFVEGVKTWGGYKFRLLQPDITKAEQNKLERFGVMRIYEEFKLKSGKVFELGVHC